MYKNRSNIDSRVEMVARRIEKRHRERERQIGEKGGGGEEQGREKLSNVVTGAPTHLAGSSRRHVSLSLPVSLSLSLFPFLPSFHLPSSFSFYIL